MNTVREPHTLQIGGQIHKVRAVSVTRIIRIDRLKHPPDGKIVFSVLIEQDISSFERSLSQIVYQLFLFES